MNTNTQALQAYCFPITGDAVRIVMAENEPWFVARDVCHILEIANSRDALRGLDPDEIGVGITDTNKGQRSASTVSESGLYALIMRSRKPAAKKFRRWITGEVIPAIRRTGRYDVAPALDHPNRILHRAMAGLLDGSVSPAEAEAVRRLHCTYNGIADGATAKRPHVDANAITPNHPWVRAIAALVASAPWEGSATDLSAVLARQGIDADARKLGRFLSQARPVFQSIGITVGDKIQGFPYSQRTYLRKISMESPILPS